jgi:Dolichyl-phosphate-mannose-protein mannosyltransferase
MTTMRPPTKAGIAQAVSRRLRLSSPSAHLSIRQRDMVILVALGILVRGLTAALIQHPGYIDAAYYYAVARNVAAGRGLTEDFIITYLVPALHVVHPSNLWWLPGASLLLVPFFVIFGSAWWVAQLPNVLLTGALPALGYALGRDLLGTRRAALGAGLLTLTSGFYYALYDPMPDNFGLYAWTAGGALFLMSQGARGRPRRFALAGLCCGLAHLARAEAPLLLAVAAIVWWWTRRPTLGSLPLLRRLAWRVRGRDELSPLSLPASERAYPPLPIWSLAALLGLYALVMAPWFVRNMLLVGAPLPPGGLQGAWLRTYNDFFSYRLTITPSTYFAWGIGSILGSKLHVVIVTAGQLIAVMDFALAPLALLGVWRLRRSVAALPWLLYGIGSYLALTLIFTFPTLYGSALHSMVAIFPFLNVAAIAGLDMVIEWVGRRRGPTSAARTAERRRVYLGIAIALSALLSTFLVLANAHAWDATAASYARAGRIATADAAHFLPLPARGKGVGGLGPVVMVADPANYYVDTGQRAIMLPDQGLPTMLAAAKRYGARYLVLEPAHSPAQNDLWSGKEHTPLLTLLWSGPGLQVYRWNY